VTEVVKSIVVLREILGRKRRERVEYAQAQPDHSQNDEDVG